MRPITSAAARKSRRHESVTHFDLSIPLGSIMGFAEHLAVLDIRVAAFAPSCNMVGVHLGHFPHALACAFMANGT